MGRNTAPDVISNFFEYDLNTVSRTLYVGDKHKFYDAEEEDDYGVGSGMADRVIKGLNILESKSHETIYIILNTTGGDIYHGRAVYDAIQQCESHIVITGYGYIMSAGSIMLQAGDTRLLAPNATLMIHYGDLREPTDEHRWEKERKRLTKWMKGIYLEKLQEADPEFTLRKLTRRMQYDWYLGAEEAVSLGFADKVLSRS